ncbi:phosphoenolpyruvate hydrolase family protein [Sporohalobacter salinus]|uniref:phosphoenolpyruvate hydrolase family protein n=1 Tax=Sporohalobacter salinus TaxID=1494606 RepID=UPI001961855C|nr:DNA-binding NtrC family response regulator/predicted TIM-barrel enzyme [Sporohalobacter salinus]
MDINNRIKESIKANKPVIGVATGSGLSAKQVAEGGVDFILVLSAGKFRSAGVSSLGCMLPFANSNDIVMDLGKKEILPRVDETPVIFGAFASDITRSHDELLENIIKSGFHGVNNFPTIGLVDGQYRKALEQNNLGFKKEVQFMKKAVDKGLFTIAFVFDKEQAEAMAKVNVDVICAHLGWTVGGEKGIKDKEKLQDSIRLTKEIFSVAEDVNPNIFHMIYGGGNIKNPRKVSKFYNQTDTIGYIGGSSFERIPVEVSIKETAKGFKNFYKLKEENQRLKEELIKKKGFDKIVGQSKAMQEIYDLIDKIANKKVNVLVTGESGTGKELVARALHYNSNRYNEPFVKINCAAIPENLLESEFFGHEKGAFTGADKQRIGKFELADGGTLFLDEIGEIDFNLQAKLLRVIQEEEFERVGSNKTIEVDVRIISATNMDLRKAVADGRFREDLYYRLNVISISTPPLRKRKEDIPLLVNHFLDEIKEKFDINILKVDSEVLDILMEYDWPGNVRELKHTIDRAAILSEDNIIKAENLPNNFRVYSEKLNSASQQTNILEGLYKNVEIVEKQIILDSLKRNNWNRTETAKVLGITRKTLYNKMKKYNIKNE